MADAERLQEARENPAETDGTRLRILEGAYSCWARDGLHTARLEKVAQEAGVARATIYRHFPGGREELLRAVISWEVGRFFTLLAEDVAAASPPEDGAGVAEGGRDAFGEFTEWVAATLAAARRRVDQHEVLHTVLREDAGQVVPALMDVLPIVLGLLREQIVDRLSALPPARRTGVDVDQAADFLARMMVSFIGTPGSWQIDDPRELRRLVRGHLLAGLELQVSP